MPPENIEVQKERCVALPNKLLTHYLNAENIQRYNTGEIGIYSVPVYAEKPQVEK